MGIDRKLIVVFVFFYLAVVIYLLMFFFILDFQKSVIKGRHSLATLTTGSNYLWVLLIAFIICFIGSASVGFPVPFPFVLFSFSNSVYIKYYNSGLVLGEILLTGTFWLEISGIAVAGGLGCALGEITSLIMGKGAKRITDSKTLDNIQGFGRLILDNPKKMYLYIFIAAALPIPDDPLWISLGMSEKKFSFTKCLLSGWLGKNVTTFFYVLLPILFLIGFTALGAETDDLSSVVTECIMLILTLTIMFLIFAFDWNKYLENRRKKENITKTTN